jgi:predicted DNA-binding transcriptional regulator YafY
VSRATQIQHTERLNLAIQLLAQAGSSSQAAAQLARSCRLSLRQAYRYVEKAQGCIAPLPVPTVKDVFTIKLPRDLIARTRQRARGQRQAISGLVSQALEAFLQ